MEGLGTIRPSLPLNGAFTAPHATYPPQLSPDGDRDSCPDPPCPAPAPIVHDPSSNNQELVNELRAQDVSEPLK